MNAERGFVHINDTRLYYEMAGSGQAVVLLHGFTLDTRMWDDQFQPLAQHFRVIRYDLRGFGQSALPTENPYSHVDDLYGLLDQLGIQQVHLMGLSKGGAVALDFALTYPHHVQSLILIDTVLGGFSSWSAESSARDRLVWQHAREGGIQAAKESWLTHPLFAPALRQPTVGPHLTRIIEEYSGWHFVNKNRERPLESPAAQRLSELNMPVLGIVGAYDLPDFRLITEQVCEQAPHACQIIIPEVGHMANMEAPEQVNTAILQFLKRL